MTATRRLPLAAAALAAAALAALSACVSVPRATVRPKAVAFAAPTPAEARPAAETRDPAPATPVPALPAPAHAPLAAPDRPGYSFGPGTVPAGGVQLESGVTEAHAGTQTYRTVGEGLLRVGVGRGTELRVSGQSYASRTDAVAPAGARTTHGVEDARVGIKQRLLAAHGATGLAATSVALIAGTTVPSGSAGFGAHAWQPEAVLMVNTPLTGRLSLVENLSDSYAAASTTPDGRRAHRVGATVAGWYTVNPKVSAFGEYAGSRLTRAGGAVPGAAAAHYVDAGLAFAPVAHVQLDLRVGAGMNGVPGDSFVGAGITRRW